MLPRKRTLYPEFTAGPDAREDEDCVVSASPDLVPRAAPVADTSPHSAQLGGMLRL